MYICVEVGSGCMIVGLLTRLLINVHFLLFFLGTFICSLGFCFMISGANKFANVWFPHHQIFLVNSICVFAIFASDAIGTFLSSFFIRKHSTRNDVFHFFVYESLAMVAIHLLMICFFRGKPKHLQKYIPDYIVMLLQLKGILLGKIYIICCIIIITVYFFYV